LNMKLKGKYPKGKQRCHTEGRKNMERNWVGGILGRADRWGAFASRQPT
jgi:hypothetical protein